MSSKIMTISQIKDTFERILRSLDFSGGFPEDDLISKMHLEYEDLEGIRKLIYKELDYLFKEQKPDQPFDSMHLNYFVNKYRLDYSKIGDGNRIWLYLHLIREQLDEEEEKFLWLDDRRNELKESFLPPKIKPPEKSFPEYLHINLKGKRKEFAEELKAEFRNEKGLKIRYMIEGLVRKGILSNLDRQRKAVYRAMEKYFNWDIGTYQGIFDLKIEDWRQPNIIGAEERIKSILERLK